MALEWTEPTGPNEHCNYDHVSADTPIGVVHIEWKGWKPNCGMHCCITAGETTIIIYGDDLDSAKRNVEDALYRLGISLIEAVSGCRGI